MNTTDTGGWKGIHPTAVVHEGSRLGEGVIIGPYAVIEEGVVLGARVRVGPHAVIQEGTVIGPESSVGAHCVLGGLPQDLRFDPSTPSGVKIGSGVTLREGVTISRATRESTNTEVDDGAFIMAYAHVGHDGSVGTGAIIANNVMMAGVATIRAHAVVGGGAAFHQGVRVGPSAMVSGLSRAARDVPPFTMVAERDELIGLNLVGLKRRGLGRDVIREIKEAYRLVFSTSGNRRTKAAAARASRSWSSVEAQDFLEFFNAGTRGFIQPRREAEAGSDG